MIYYELAEMPGPIGRVTVVQLPCLAHEYWQCSVM